MHCMNICQTKMRARSFTNLRIQMEIVKCTTHKGSGRDLHAYFREEDNAFAQMVILLSRGCSARCFTDIMTVGLANGQLNEYVETQMHECQIGGWNGWLKSVMRNWQWVRIPNLPANIRQRLLTAYALTKKFNAYPGCAFLFVKKMRNVNGSIQSSLGRSKM